MERDGNKKDGRVERGLEGDGVGDEFAGPFYPRFGFGFVVPFA